MNDDRPEILPKILEERIWEEGFEGHRKAQAKRLASLPFIEKLRWLEEAHLLVLSNQKAREKQVEWKEELNSD